MGFIEQKLNYGVGGGGLSDPSTSFSQNKAPQTSFGTHTRGWRWKCLDVPDLVSAKWVLGTEPEIQTIQDKSTVKQQQGYYEVNPDCSFTVYGGIHSIEIKKGDTCDCAPGWTPKTILTFPQLYKGPNFAPPSGSIGSNLAWRDALPSWDTTPFDSVNQEWTLPGYGAFSKHLYIPNNPPLDGTVRANSPVNCENKDQVSVNSRTQKLYQYFYNGVPNSTVIFTLTPYIRPEMTAAKAFKYNVKLQLTDSTGKKILLELAISDTSPNRVTTQLAIPCGTYAMVWLGDMCYLPVTGQWERDWLFTCTNTVSGVTVQEEKWNLRGFWDHSHVWTYNRYIPCRVGVNCRPAGFYYHTEAHVIGLQGTDSRNIPEYIATGPKAVPPTFTTPPGTPPPPPTGYPCNGEWSEPCTYESGNCVGFVSSPYKLGHYDNRKWVCNSSAKKWTELEPNSWITNRLLHRSLTDWLNKDDPPASLIRWHYLADQPHYLPLPVFPSTHIPTPKPDPYIGPCCTSSLVHTAKITKNDSTN